MKLLTVVIPCYNSQDYMEKCIRSILPGGERVEIIIIDDGSKDNTGRIADEYAQKYPSIIRVIHQENGGHGEGINQGLLHASGRYFKVVDSDDCLSNDLPAFLEYLEQFDQQGGTDLVVTNYYYVHSDGVGDRSINYSNALPTNRVMKWSETKSFRVHQLLTIHSCTFRTEVMRESGMILPKHTFYEDNLMVYAVLPHVKRLSYLNMDLYRYTIGREGQSVQKDIMMSRYTHQLRVTQMCFESVHLDTVADKRLKKYMKHELFMMFSIATLYSRLNQSEEAEQDLVQMWKKCELFDARYTRILRRTPLALINMPGKAGRRFVKVIYGFAHKVVRFN